MHTLIYDIPIDKLTDERDSPVIIRTDNPAHLLNVPHETMRRVVGIRIASLDQNTHILNAWRRGLPIELVITDPAREFPLLYHHTGLFNDHPVRCSIPVQKGIEQAIRVAIALGFPVQLRMEQPDIVLIDALLSAADFYLHNPTVRQPILLFHEMVVGFLNDTPFSLWDIAEDAPYRFRHITDGGAETLPSRLKEVPINLFEQGIDLTSPTCLDCTCSSYCRGYFTWPDRAYDCTGIRKLFLFLKEAAFELRADLEYIGRGENTHG